MGVRVTINGRVALQRDIRHRPICRAEYGNDGQQQFFHGVAPQQKPWPAELVDGALHIENNVRYRVVDSKVLRPDQGWGSAVYWCRLLLLTTTQLHRLTRKGYFDAAISDQTGSKRYRCLDYRKTHDFVTKSRTGPKAKRGPRWEDVSDETD